MKLSKLKLHPTNPRKIDPGALDKLKESIQRDPEFMVLRPIVYDADGTILGGNQRYRACKALGMKEVLQFSDQEKENVEQRLKDMLERTHLQV